MPGFLQNLSWAERNVSTCTCKVYHIHIPLYWFYVANLIIVLHPLSLRFTVGLYLDHTNLCAKPLWDCLIAGNQLRINIISLLYKPPCSLIIQLPRNHQHHPTPWLLSEWALLRQVKSELGEQCPHKHIIIVIGHLWKLSSRLWSLPPIGPQPHYSTLIGW